MPESPLVHARYPTQDDGPYGGEQIQAAVLDLEPYTVPRFVDAADRDAKVLLWTQAGNALEGGMLCYTKADRRQWRWDASVGAWVYAGGAPPAGVPFTAFVNGWLNFGAPWTPLTCYKDASGLVHVEGVIKPAAAIAAGGNSVIGTLPSDFWPASTRMNVTSYNGAAVGRIDVAANGLMTYSNGSAAQVPAAAYVPLNGVYNPAV